MTKRVFKQFQEEIKPLFNNFYNNITRNKDIKHMTYEESKEYITESIIFYINFSYNYYKNNNFIYNKEIDNFILCCIEKLQFHLDDLIYTHYRINIKDNKINIKLIYEKEMDKIENDNKKRCQKCFFNIDEHETIEGIDEDGDKYFCLLCKK